MVISSSPEPWPQPDWIDFTQILLNSYAHWRGFELLERIGSPLDQSRTLWQAPFVVVAHGTQPDPILCYANQEALDLWEISLAEFLQTPSRLTAEPMHRDERARMLQQTESRGYFDDYRGIRISKSGRRFLIDRAVVWNLIDSSGHRVGQAATFSHWTFLPAQSPPSDR